MPITILLAQEFPAISAEGKTQKTWVCKSSQYQNSCEPLRNVRLLLGILKIGLKWEYTMNEVWTNIFQWYSNPANIENWRRSFSIFTVIYHFSIGFDCSISEVSIHSTGLGKITPIPWICISLDRLMNADEPTYSAMVKLHWQKGDKANKKNSPMKMKT